MKIFILTKRRILSFVGIALFVSLLLTGAFTANAVTSSAKVRKLPIYAVNTNEKKIALTLDCAWENSDTQELLDIFEQNNIKATFFTTGDFCNRYPEDIKLIYQNGHAIENHSYNHPHVAKISKEKLIEDTTKCDEIITELTGKKPTLYRAPYGEYSNDMLDIFDSELLHRVIQWDIDSRDWQGREAADMITTVTKGVKNGSIILFHNDTKNTPATLKQIIPTLKGEGYEFVLVEDLIYKEKFILDHEGRQTKF